mmetsp:Transcript_10973/g.13861  ORF Transcript_10973/g.13861 Transcript_10973/m.13861 type:complete len:186 (-) Transcript_10973:82-639(-)|eukprot:CAMPEP_0170472360 /NCGR_PEP_ID=MMETSP0123-20130129/14412_1 /TAXON_ID=182087 /ORGANISM="Favella ehrenbergii, Strain Fehren 1" /LENGTH=185 /DNA_ID=CAMNT_0010740595 /DNA_START=74 /DNA_END=631 /DNA_ORIENTATION=-
MPLLSQIKTSSLRSMLSTAAVIVAVDAVEAAVVAMVAAMVIADAAAEEAMAVVTVDMVADAAATVAAGAVGAAVEVTVEVTVEAMAIDAAVAAMPRLKQKARLKVSNALINKSRLSLKLIRTFCLMVASEGGTPLGIEDIAPPVTDLAIAADMAHTIAMVGKTTAGDVAIATTTTTTTILAPNRV